MQAFNLFKALTLEVSYPARNLPLYALAARLLLCPAVPAQFTVSIECDNPCLNITVNRDNIVTIPFEYECNGTTVSIFRGQDLHIKGVPGLAHGDWVRHLVELIGEELQFSRARPQNKVAVTRVSMKRSNGAIQIDCRLVADDDADIGNLWDGLQMWGGTGIRWQRLQTFGLVKATFDDHNKVIRFSIGQRQ